jgi:nucleoside-diphosphate-sugar epimerase
LLTGASGFIGRGLLLALQQNSQWQVRAVSRSPAPKGQSTTTQFFQIPALDDQTDWRPALAGGVETVIHTAARVHLMRETATDALAAFRSVNVAGTLHLAREAAAAGVRRFIFLSSIGVNGNGQAHPYRETDTPAPQTPYAQSKLEAEQGLLRLSMETGMEVVVIRPPLVYGPDAPGNFGRLVKLVQYGLPLPLGRVKNQRSLVSRDNLVSFIMTCLWHPQAANQIFLISDGEDLSTPELIRQMATAMQKSDRLWPMPISWLRLGAVCTRRQNQFQQLAGDLQVDISKARSLGWKPPLSVGEGIRLAMFGKNAA